MFHVVFTIFPGEFLTTVKPQLSGLVGTGMNGLDNQGIQIIQNMNINEPRAK